jgi:hypothetical protein
MTIDPVMRLAASEARKNDGGDLVDFACARHRRVVHPERTHISNRCAIIAKGPGSEENKTSGTGADDEHYWPLTDGP